MYFEFNSKLSSIAAQSIMLVALLLCCELTFMGGLAWLASQTEMEAQRMEKARLITSRANRLSLVVYDTGDAMGRYSRYLRGTEEQLADSEVQAPALIAWLKEAVKGKEPAEEILDRIDRNISICLPVLKQLQSHQQTTGSATAGGGSGGAGDDGGGIIGAGTTGGDKDYWDRQRNSIQPNVNALLKEMPALIRECRRLESEIPDRQVHYRKLTRVLLVAGLVLNIVAALIVTYFFFNRITRRLDVIADNVSRFEEGKELSPLLGGADELAQVDSVFHQTAIALRKQIRILQANEIRVRNLITNLPIGLALLNENGAIEFVNHHAEQLFASSADEMRGRQLNTFFSGSEKLIEEASVRARNKSYGESFEVRGIKRNGNQIPIDFRMATINLENSEKMLAMMVDASERFRLRQARQNFISMVRNELKRPLTNIADFLSALSGGAYGALLEKGESASKTMKQNVSRLISLLNDLFDLDKLESGQIDIQPRRCQLNQILSRSIDAVAFVAQKSKVTLECAETDISVHADDKRIVQVLVNLLSNAIKFSPSGTTVSLRVRSYPEHVQVEVSDQGRGIADEDQAAIFEPFRQAESGDAPKKEGTGLGLAICKAIIEAHGGQIGVQSRLAHGSVFWLRLPLNGNSAG